MAFIDFRDQSTLNRLGISPYGNIFFQYGFEEFLAGDDTFYGPDNG